MLTFGDGWYPPDYYNAAINFFVDAVKSFRAKTMGDAVNLFEDSKYKREMVAYQQLHSDMGGLQGSVNTLSSKGSKINSKNEEVNFKKYKTASRLFGTIYQRAGTRLAL